MVIVNPKNGEWDLPMWNQYEHVDNSSARGWGDQTTGWRDEEMTDEPGRVGWGQQKWDNPSNEEWEVAGDGILV